MKKMHLLIEGFCDGEKLKSKYPCKGTLEFSIDCFECPQFSYTHCPNEISISNEKGIVEESIGFGGEMEPDDMEERDKYISIWNSICKKKINEAYEEYFDEKNY